jgi:hypothetical protein
MNVDVMKIFIRDHLGPLFRQRHIATKILIWDFNWDGSWYPEAIISDSMYDSNDIYYWKCQDCFSNKDKRGENIYCCVLGINVIDPTKRAT